MTRAGLRLLLNGDASQWDRAMQMPHYNTHSMPAVSLHTGAHLIQVLSPASPPITRPPHSLQNCLGKQALFSRAVRTTLG